MALANSRPLQIPTADHEVLLNNASPVFQPSASALGVNSKDMTSLAQSPGSNNSNQSNIDPTNNISTGNNSSSKQVKKEKEPPALEISKLLPVTGERPCPTERDAPLDDDVLFAVFGILWEQDANQNGMTVKQLCDLLLFKHPEMSTLSTKLSNLISAKLNAYVKKLEKGEKTLKYALSREWSDSTPRRMVYVYRGILASDYKNHALAAAKQLKRNDSTASQGSSSNSSSNKKSQKHQAMQDVSQLNISLQAAEQSAFSQTLGLGPQIRTEFNIPYSTSPVSASLTPNKINQISPASNNNNNNNGSNSTINRLDPDQRPTKKQKKSSTSLNEQNNNTSSSSPSQTPYITAAAAAPRISKLLGRSSNGSSNNNKPTISGNSKSAIDTVSAIHNVMSTQMPVEAIISKQSEYVDGLLMTPWVKTVREGFLEEDIDSPESLTMDALDSFFD